MKRLLYQVVLLITAFLIITGCGESSKQPPPGPSPKQEAPAPQTTGPATTTPGAPGAAKQPDCYEIGYKTGRCVAKSMSNLPCDAGDEIPMPPECKGKPETDKGLTEGRKSVY
jgi:hypothetical protein